MEREVRNKALSARAADMWKICGTGILTEGWGDFEKELRPVPVRLSTCPSVLVIGSIQSLFRQQIPGILMRKCHRPVKALE